MSLSKLGGMNEQTLAGLRSMLTHPDATAHAREVLQQETCRLADRMDGPHADTRAALLLATNLGVAISREILGLQTLRDSQPNELLDLLRPAVRALSRSPAPRDSEPRLRSINQQARQRAEKQR